MFTSRVRAYLAIIFAFCFCITYPVDDGFAEQNGARYILHDVTVDAGKDTLTFKMIGSSVPSFTKRELYDPFRLILDIANLDMADGVDIDNMMPKNELSELQVKKIRGDETEISRFIFTIQEGFRHQVEREGNNLIVYIMPEDANSKQKVTSKSAIEESAEEVRGNRTTDPAAEKKMQELIESTAEVVESDRNGEARAEELVEGFDFSGYKRKKISVDFYKIDLHNVFRLFRQVGDMNLIVDEAVSGSLTLALDDVPWDFALDIILNLAELEKEEKFNTIVVYPKDKEFQWPERASDNLSFEADLQVVEEEALIIEQSANQPKEIMKAKEIIREARKKEEKEDYEDAVALYTEAAKLWPDNAKLTSKLAAIYLVRLGMNAKAVFYAKQSLAKEPDNYSAALYAAIGNANMNNVQTALEYFDRSISGDPPMKEALASFAAFSESNGRLRAALKLYDKFHDHYGATVDTMVAKARIYDRLGMEGKALEQYQTVLASGFKVQYGLKQYIQNRISEAQN